MNKEADSASESQPQAYAPSWVDRFTAWVGRLPGPSWAYYLGIALVLLLVEILVLWGEGVLHIGEVLAMHVFTAGITAYLLALHHFLDNKAGAAFASLRPVLNASERESDDLRRRLTTLPMWPTLLAGLSLSALTYLLDELLNRFADRPDILAPLAPSPISYWVWYGLYRLLWFLFGTLLYHTVHQLRQISRIYTKHTRVNLFRMGPLYAFSSVTALTAVGLAIPPYGFFALFPGLLRDPISIAYLVPITGLVFGAFVWPLVGIHRLLAREKGRLLDEAAQRFETAIAELHRRMDNGELDGMDGLNKAMASLEVERKALDRIPTWPWQPETVRLLTTALALPLGLWIVQFVLQRVLAP